MRQTSLSPHTAPAPRTNLTTRMANPHSGTAAASSSAAASAASPKGLALAAAIHKYDSILLDQFGVLHDGVAPFPWAIKAVRYLAEERRARVVILSNSSRRSDGTICRLKKIGFEPQWFGGVVTSGDVAHELLGHKDAARRLWDECDPIWDHIAPAPTRGPHGRRLRAIHFVWNSRGGAGGVSDLDGLPIDVTADPDTADIIIAHGADALSIPDDAGRSTLQPMSQEEATALMAACAERRLPFLCANPDIVTVAGAGGALARMPGALAAEYVRLGCPADRVHLLGKPSACIYRLAAHRFLSGEGKSGEGQGNDKAAVLAIGDSIAHDIAGAAAFGVDSCFIVETGIHAEDMRGSEGDAEALCRAHGLALPPTIVAARFEIEECIL